jgi:DNA-binding IclR family transcriptional regulator
MRDGQLPAPRPPGQRKIGPYHRGVAAYSATARIVAVLEAFDSDHDRLTLSQLSRRAKIPLTSTHRLVTELTSRRILERDDAGRLSIGLRLWELASRAPRTVGLRELALPFLEDLYEATHENVQLAVRDGTELVYVERIAGRGAVNVLTQVGLRFTLPATGVGLVLLAYADSGVQDQVLSGPLTTFTAHTIVDRRVLRRVLAEVRRTGIAISDRQVTDDALSVAAPIRGPGGAVVAAVSLVVAADTATPATLIPVVAAAARGISRAVVAAAPAPAMPAAAGAGRPGNR